MPLKSNKEINRDFASIFRGDTYTQSRVGTSPFQERTGEQFQQDMTEYHARVAFRVLVPVFAAGAAFAVMWYFGNYVMCALYFFFAVFIIKHAGMLMQLFTSLWLLGVTGLLLWLGAKGAGWM